MRVERCLNGHFYDGDKYTKCPHCEEYATAYKQCYFCFKFIDFSASNCRYCGRAVENKTISPYLDPGTIIASRYVIGQACDNGGYGIVYRAWDKKLDNVVAVKEFFVFSLMTRQEHCEEVLVSKKNNKEEFEYRKKRFLSEARNMALFSANMNIPNVYDYFEENGTAYIVEELLEGCTLKEYLDERGGRIDKDLAILITIQVGNALTTLHEKGIIHRDVSPDNIFMCNGSDLKIKLLDLGSARLYDSDDGVIDIVLKPGYSPIEQYMCDSCVKTGPRADIYALGATLYRMITGKMPDEAPNRKVSDAVPLPNQINPNISKSLSKAVMKAMAVEESERYESVESFMATIRKELFEFDTHIFDGINKDSSPVFKRKTTTIDNTTLGMFFSLDQVLGKKEADTETPIAHIPSSIELTEETYLQRIPISVKNDPNPANSVNEKSTTRCKSCMEEYRKELKKCPHCGYKSGDSIGEVVFLQPGTLLDKRYSAGKATRGDGPIVSYIAWDEILSIKVAIKEYLPCELSTRSLGQSDVTVFDGKKRELYQDGLNKFVKMGKRLVRLQNNPNIVKTIDCFSENGTAYIVLEYIEGEPLDKLIHRKERFSAEQAGDILYRILSASKIADPDGFIFQRLLPEYITITYDGSPRLNDSFFSQYSLTNIQKYVSDLSYDRHDSREDVLMAGDNVTTNMFLEISKLFEMMVGNEHLIVDDL